MTTSEEVGKAFRLELWPQLRSILEPTGFRVRTSKHDFVRKAAGRSETLQLLLSCYTGRPYDFIVDYGVRIEDTSVEAVLLRWDCEHTRDWLGFFVAGSGLHHDAVASSELFHDVANLEQAASTIGRVLKHLVSLLDAAHIEGYVDVFGDRGVPIDYYPFMAADCMRRGKIAKAGELIDRLPPRFASLRQRAYDELGRSA